ncbi:MAG: ABC transporter substrate-binding protein [Pirellulaceae bacterium]
MVRTESKTTSDRMLHKAKNIVMPRVVRFGFFVLFSIAFAGCSSKKPSVPQSVDGKIQVEIALNWIPDAQHGGFYAAQALGFFEDAGLEVTLTPGGPNSPVLQKVADAQTPIFGVANADQVLTGREVGMPIRAVLAAMQDSPRCIIVRNSSGITSLHDLKNVTLAVGAGKTFVKYLEKHLDLSGVTVASYTGSLRRS